MGQIITTALSGHAFDLQKKLERRGINFNKLREVLTSTKSVIAGSYIIQTILGVEWVSDIDIWCEMRHSRNMSLLEPFFNFFIHELGYKMRKVSLGDGEYTRLRKYIKQIVCLDKKGFPKIQIITAAGSYLDCIRTFDLDVCRVYYHPPSNSILQVGEDTMEKCSSRKMMVTTAAIEEQSLDEWLRTLVRILKYKRRGFTINISNVVEHLRALSQSSRIAHSPRYTEIFANFRFRWNLLLFENFELHEHWDPLPFLTENFHECVSRADEIDALRMVKTMDYHRGRVSTYWPFGRAIFKLPTFNEKPKSHKSREKLMARDKKRRVMLVSPDGQSEKIIDRMRTHVNYREQTKDKFRKLIKARVLQEEGKENENEDREMIKMQVPYDLYFPMELNIPHRELVVFKSNQAIAVILHSQESVVYVKPVLNSRGEHVYVNIDMSPIDAVNCCYHIERLALYSFHEYSGIKKSGSYGNDSTSDSRIKTSTVLTSEMPSRGYLGMLREKVSSNGMDFDTLAQVLSETRSVIAGSFVMQVILGEEWRTDMDIWCNMATPSQNIALLLPFFNYFVRKLGYRFKKYNTADIHNSDYARLRKYVSTIVCLYHPSDEILPKIQIITTHAPCVDVISTFDLNACRVYYDPSWTLPNSSMRQVGNAFDQCLSRKMAVTEEAIVEQSLYEWLRTLRRIIKYLRRGFDVSCKNIISHLKQLYDIGDANARNDLADMCRVWNMEVFRNFDVKHNHGETLPIFKDGVSICSNFSEILPVLSAANYSHHTKKYPNDMIRKTRLLGRKMHSNDMNYRNTLCPIIIDEAKLLPVATTNDGDLIFIYDGAKIVLNENEIEFKKMVAPVVTDGIDIVPNTFDLYFPLNFGLKGIMIVRLIDIITRANMSSDRVFHLEKVGIPEPTSLDVVSSAQFKSISIRPEDVSIRHVCKLRVCRGESCALTNKHKRPPVKILTQQ